MSPTLPKTMKMNGTLNDLALKVLAGLILAACIGGAAHVLSPGHDASLQRLAEHIEQARLDTNRLETTVEALRADVQELTAEVAGLAARLK